jgi:tRNA threonylcarbamoyladenosine biosynthesis protein TsaB
MAGYRQFATGVRKHVGFKVLGFDASSSAVTVGLIDEGRPLGLLSVAGPRLAGAHLVEWIQQQVALFGPPDGLAVGVGPGSFTGVRVAVSAAKALAFGWQIPVVGVSSLAAWARAAGDHQRVVVSSERRGPAFYLGYYWTGDDTAQPLMPDMAISGSLPSIFPVAEPVVVLGPAADDPRLCDQIGPAVRPLHRHISALDVALLGWPALQWGQGDDPVSLAPSYLRPPAIGGVSEVPYGPS